jgi:hypothetical protein
MLANHKRAPKIFHLESSGGRAWSKMVKKARFKSPSTHASILASNFWWNSIVQPTKEGFHEKRVSLMGRDEKEI